MPGDGKEATCRGTRLNGLKYLARIGHNNKMYEIGDFVLSADAALCYDEAAALLKGSRWRTNFKSESEYLEAREQEIQKRGLCKESTCPIDYVRQHIQQYIIKLRDSVNDKIFICKGTCRTGGEYYARIRHNNDVFHLGGFVLNADAALCYDKANVMLKGTRVRTNFQSKSHYLTAREKEIQKRGICGESVCPIGDAKQLIQQCIIKLQDSVNANKLIKNQPGHQKSHADHYSNHKKSSHCRQSAVKRKFKDIEVSEAAPDRETLTSLGDDTSTTFSADETIPGAEDLKKYKSVTETSVQAAEDDDAEWLHTADLGGANEPRTQELGETDPFSFFSELEI